MAHLERDFPLKPGDVLSGRYEVLGLLGGGTAAFVHRARDGATRREVVLKVAGRVPSAGGQDPLAEELHAYAKLSHPSIPRLIDSGKTPDGRSFAVLELVEGRTLRAVLDEKGSLEPVVAVRLMGEILDALVAVHRAGIVHRDVKPENIMVTCTGAVQHAVLLDFGFGASSAGEKRTSSAPELLGTPRYASPEQLRGEAPTPRSDLYSWALTLLECLSGTSVIRGETARDAVARQLDGEPVALPGDLRRTPLGRFLEKATAKDPSQRFAGSAEAIVALAGLAPAIAVLLDEVRDVRAPSALDRVVTVLSGRLVDARSLDGEDHLRLETSAVVQLCRSAGGTVVSVVGNRITAVFGLRVEEEHDASHALEAAFAMIERPASPGVEGAPAAWSIGIHTGTIGLFPASGAIDEPESFPGPTFEVAAALDEIAGPGRVLMSESTAQAVREIWSATGGGVLRSSALAEPLRTFRPRSRRRGLRDSEATAFTGRTQELARVREAWAAVLEGRPRSLLLSGSAGVGKSRLVRQVRHMADDAEWLEAGCSIERQTVPLGLLVHLVQSFDSSSVGLARRYRLPTAECVPVLATVLGEPVVPGYPQASATPERQRELTVQAAIRLLVNMAADGPTILVLEDLQWADSSSLGFVHLLLQELSRLESVGTALPLLVILTARDEFARGWNEQGVIRVEVRPMDAAEAAAMVRAGVSEEAPAGDELIAEVVAASRGNALFLEQATRLIARRTATLPKLDGADTAVVPDSLPTVLAAHIALLGAQARSLVQVAAAIGQEFGVDVLAAVTRLRPRETEAAIEELLRAGLVRTVSEARPARHAFVHALVREAAYESLPVAQRSAVHRRIAEQLAADERDIAASKPAELATHYELAGEAMAAADLWHRAGVQALAKAAYPEACKDLERGVRLLDALPETPERTLRALGMTTALGSAQVSMKGFGARESREAFLKARRLCDRMGREIPLEILGGIFGAALGNADADETAAVLPHFRSMAGRTDSPIFAFSGHQVLAVHAGWSGRFDESHHHATRAIELYRREAVHGVAWEFGFGIHCYAYGMMALFRRGFPDQAEAIRREMMERAQGNGNPHCLAVALGWSTTLSHDFGRAEETLEVATRLAHLSEEQHLLVWSAFASCGRSSALVAMGRIGEGLEAIRRALAILDATGFRCSYSYYLAYLSRALLAGGELEEARAVIREGMDLCASIWTRMAEAEHVRLHGVLLERLGDRESAALELRRAARIAAADGDRAMQLRALTDLVQLPNREARDLAELVAVTETITEGATTADVRRARESVQEFRRKGAA